MFSILRDVGARRTYLTFLMPAVAVAVMVSACKDNSVIAVNAPHPVPAAAFGKSVPNVDSLKVECQRAALKLTQSRGWIRQSLLDSMRTGPIPIAAIDTSLPRELFILNYATETNDSGTTYDTAKFAVRVEMLNPDNAGFADVALNSSMNYGVMENPDLFYDQNGTPGSTYYVTMPRYGLGTSAVALARPDTVDTELKAKIDAIEDPVFIVTLERLEPGESAANRQVSRDMGKQSTNEYLVVKEIRLKTKMDSSPDEFELYLGEGTYNINGTTSHRFDGKSRNDAKGQSRTYVNIDNRQNYIMPNNIYLANLTGVTVRMVAIEDDDDPGMHDRTGSTSRIFYIDAHRVSTNTRVSNDWTLNIPGKHGLFSDPDDVYRSSGVDNINVTTMNARGALSSYFYTDDGANPDLGDVDYRLGMRY